MKFYVFILFVLVGMIMISCEEEESVDMKSQLVGKWDAYVSISENGTTYEYPSDILMNYEYGFELFADGTYRPRYFNDQDSVFYTSEEFKHYWTLIDNNVIAFTYKKLDGNRIPESGGFGYKIVKLDDELWIGEGLQYRLRKGE